MRWYDICCDLIFRCSLANIGLIVWCSQIIDWFCHDYDRMLWLRLSLRFMRTRIKIKSKSMAFSQRRICIRLHNKEQNITFSLTLWYRTRQNNSARMSLSEIRRTCIQSRTGDSCIECVLQYRLCPQGLVLIMDSWPHHVAGKEWHSSTLVTHLWMVPFRASVIWFFKEAGKDRHMCATRSSWFDKLPVVILSVTGVLKSSPYFKFTPRYLAKPYFR